MRKFIINLIKNIASQSININIHELDGLRNGKGLVTYQTEVSALESLIQRLFPVIGEKQPLIRLGGKGDGGYLLPDDLTGIEACFSPGVHLISKFEKDCAEIGMKVFLADKSVESPSEDHELFVFTPKYIGALENSEFMTIDTWVNHSLPGSESDLLLQMDIEGYEYETMMNISDNLMKRFRIIVVEFHNLDQLYNFSFFNFASRVFEKFLQTHSCVHIHPNNCCGFIKKNGLEIPKVAEFTFYRNDRINNPSFSTNFPHPLDQDNTPNPPLILPKCWYKSQYS